MALEALTIDRAGIPQSGLGILEFERVGPKSVCSRAYATNPLRFLTPQNSGRTAWVYTSSLGGDKVPRKGGPGITQSDLVIINKTDLASHVGANLEVMARDAAKMRGDGPFVFAQVRNGIGMPEICQHILATWKSATQPQLLEESALT